MAEQTSQMVDIDTQNVNPSLQAERKSAVYMKEKDAIDKHINSILGSEYFGKEDGFLAFNNDKNINKHGEGFSEYSTPVNSSTAVRERTEKVMDDQLHKKQSENPAEEGKETKLRLISVRTW